MRSDQTRGIDVQVQKSVCLVLGSGMINLRMSPREIAWNMLACQVKVEGRYEKEHEFHLSGLGRFG